MIKTFECDVLNSDDSFRAKHSLRITADIGSNTVVFLKSTNGLIEQMETFCLNELNMKGGVLEFHAQGGCFNLYQFEFYPVSARDTMFSIKTELTVAKMLSGFFIKLIELRHQPPRRSGGFMS